MLTLYKIVSELNSRATTHPIGTHQSLRKRLKKHQRVSTQKLFTEQTTTSTWAFHHGGRSELQFNVGIEEHSGEDALRYGVAFSFETSQSLPSIEVLIPKVSLFN